MRTTWLTGERGRRSRRFRGLAAMATALSVAVKKSVTFRRLALALTTSALFAGLLVTPASAIPGVAALPPPSICPANPWVMDLKTGVPSGFLPGVTVTSFDKPSRQAVVTLDLNPFFGIKCTQANIVVEYEGQPTGWTVNIGDSSTNNGFGGGVPGTTESCAEVQVRNSPFIAGPTSRVNAYRDCTVDNDPNNPIPLEDPLSSPSNPNPLSLKDGALKFVVKNEHLSVGQPFAQVDDPLMSFNIPDNLGPNPDGSKIYAAFNRVISGPGDRIGTGARRVMITME